MTSTLGSAGSLKRTEGQCHIRENTNHGLHDAFELRLHILGQLLPDQSVDHFTPRVEQAFGHDFHIIHTTGDQDLVVRQEFDLFAGTLQQIPEATVVDGRIKELVLFRVVAIGNAILALIPQMEQLYLGLRPQLFPTLLNLF